MPGYLLDSNHVSALFNEHPKVVAEVRRVGESQVRACVIALGEAEAGHQMNLTTNQQRRDEFREFLNTIFLPNAIGISKTTRITYAMVMGRLWQKFPPKSKRIKTERHLVAHGIDINDVWTVAVALEHNLVLITRDKMAPIRDVVPELHIENWMQ